MDCYIIHIGVRTRPELAAEVVAQVGDETVEVSLDDAVIRRLCGAGLPDEEAALLALNHNAREIGIAIEAYVLAGRLPPDGHIFLSWEDFSPTIAEISEASAAARERAGSTLPTEAGSTPSPSVCHVRSRSPRITSTATPRESPSCRARR